MREGWQKFKVTGLNDRDVARHIAFCHDFLYKVLDTEPMPEGGRTIWINDLKGLPFPTVICALDHTHMHCSVEWNRTWPVYTRL